ncbi:cytochrome c oxidase subunit II [Candidatus Atelocyanobacterium thalassae]|uniref:Cytochrome c oxidase subunit 2 n=2 Tax=Candidatus Atelocyanobacterium thalassae TaxID=713887 RepID=A0A086CHX2_9CHRO|nr:cytochrome c oxidase subunit II [Candidatus Atelocyanobacterium thalassa]KFF41786.1 MAG: cytochrome c oxidase subunit II [Candidatus Atelocyanobacterium thalassa isolate SIO64986]BDA39419.1 hypothetical protein CPARK_000025800 [cyanobacterium endosymbiont of Braarudosphaera bigelowii]
MNIPSSIITLIAGVLITLISLWYGQNHGLMPVAASENAEEVDKLFNFMMTIATGLFLLVEGSLVYSLFKFRRRKGDTSDGPHIEGNVALEVVWTAIPVMIVFVLAFYSFQTYNKLGGLDPVNTKDSPPQQIAINSHDDQIALGIGKSFGKDVLSVDVQAMQYAWLFTYPETGIVSGELHVPNNRPVQLDMTAKDVLHAFWVPQLRLKQDTIPGRKSIISFIPTVEGDYPIVCAELCGPYHGGMKSVLHVDSQDSYDEWLKSNKPIQEAHLEKTLTVDNNSSNEKFLTPYIENMGTEKDTVAELPNNYPHHDS